MKKGIPKKNEKQSAVMNDEVKRMEQRLEELKEFMSTEREKRAAEPKFQDGSNWRSGSSKVPNSNYTDMVLNYQKDSGRKIKVPKSSAETKPVKR
jgi:hypothetical protein